MSLFLVTTAIILYLLPSFTIAKNCNGLANSGDCLFYIQCLEEEKIFRCQDGDYSFGFTAYQYCNDFENSKCFSSRGANWIKKVSKCIIKAIYDSEVYESGEDCDDLYELAFDSLGSCYMENNFCNNILNNNGCDDLLCIGQIFADDKKMIARVLSSTSFCKDQLPSNVIEKCDESIRHLSVNSLSSNDHVIAMEQLFLQAIKDLFGSCKSSIDVIFLLDSFSSVDSSDFNTVKNFLKNITSKFNIGDNKTRVGIIEFSESASVVLPLGAINNISQLSNFIDSIAYQYTGNETRADLALNLLSTAFGTARTNQGIPQVAVVLTDGISDDFTLTLKLDEAAKSVHATGITVYALGIGSEVGINELDTIATSSSNVFSIANFSVDEFASVSLRLRTAVCTTPTFTAVSNVIGGALEISEARLLAFDFPNEGITLKIDITQGQLQVYGSFSILNPNSLTADFSFQSTSDGISYFISPELYQSSTIRFNVSRSADLYISLIGLQNNNIFLLNSTFGDTSDARCIMTNFLLLLVMLTLSIVVVVKT